MDLSEARIVMTADNQHKQLELWCPVLSEAGRHVEIAVAIGELSAHRGDGTSWPAAGTPRASAGYSERAHLVQAAATRYSTTTLASE